MRTIDWQRLVTDVVIIVAMTLLALRGTIPSEAVIAVLSAIAGARGSERNAKAPPLTGTIGMVVLGLVTAVGGDRRA